MRVVSVQNATGQPSLEMLIKSGGIVLSHRLYALSIIACRALTRAQIQECTLEVSRVCFIEKFW
jgi:hypothetical protein